MTNKKAPPTRWFISRPFKEPRSGRRSPTSNLLKRSTKNSPGPKKAHVFLATNCQESRNSFQPALLLTNSWTLNLCLHHGVFLLAKLMLRHLQPGICQKIPGYPVLMNESLESEIGKSAALKSWGNLRWHPPHATTRPTFFPSYSSGAAVERRKDLLARPAPPRPGQLSEILGQTNVEDFGAIFEGGHYIAKIQTMHYYKGNLLKLPYLCIVWFPQSG